MYMSRVVFQFTDYTLCSNGQQIVCFDPYRDSSSWQQWWTSWWLNAISTEGL